MYRRLQRRAVQPRQRARRLFLESLETRRMLAAIPTATLLSVPADPLIGEDVQFTVRFDNTSPSDIGYGPFVNLFLPATGADGAGAELDDGLTFVSASYLGSPINATLVTLTAAGVPHPYAKDASGSPILITLPTGFEEGDQLVVLEVPYGSFTPSQPPADIQVTAQLSNLADANVPLVIQAQGGFRFGNDGLDNPTSDPSLLGAAATASTTPTVFRLTKTYVGPEDETVTGPNYPREYQISVDIADGQTITNLDLSDILAPELQFLAVTSTSGATSDISTPSTATPGGTLTRRFASVTGTSGQVDAQMTFRFFAPRIDAPLSPILNPVTGDDRAVIDDASAEGLWQPIDTRDPLTPVESNVTANDHTLTLKSIATQKTLAIVNDVGVAGLSPGDTVEYTIAFQVSDYFAFQNIVLTDLFSDGQDYVPLSATLAVSDGHGVGGFVSGIFAPANLSLSENFVGGSDQLLLRVSDELAARGFSPNGRLVGGAIPAGGTGGPPPASNPPLPFGATQGTVTFRTVVQDEFEVDFPSGDAAINPGDTIGNAITISGDLLSVADLTPNGNSEADNSSASEEIVRGAFSKSVYAINGNLNPGPTPGVSPGDLVTYRLRLSLTTGDVENLRFDDYLPLPIFDVDDTGAVTGVDTIVSATAPAAGRAKFGPDDTFFALSGIVPVIDLDSAANSVSFVYGTYDDPTNTPVIVDLLFTVTVSNDPFADQLLLSNGAEASANNTSGSAISGDAIAQIVLQEPALNISKGVVATDNPAGIFSPSLVGPVAFNAPGTAGPRFGGTINSAGLNAAPIDSNLAGIDQGDLVTFAIVVENTGSSPAGAFDVEISDTLPEGFVLPGIGAFGVNLRVTDGAGNTIAFEAVGNGILDGVGGIRLIDPALTQGAIGAGSVGGVPVQDGSNIVIITLDLLSSGNLVNQIMTDVATLESYAGDEGGPNFVPDGLADDANVQIASPTMTKELVSTEIVNTINTNNEAVIGELVTYRVRITIPEGTTPDATLLDTLDPELAFVELVSSSVPASVILDGGFITPDSVTNSGRTIHWSLGSLVNSDTNNSVSEVIELIYTAVVVNTADANAGDQVNNQAQFNFASAANPIIASASNVTVIEPQVQIDKSVAVDGAGNIGDASDSFVYTIVLTNLPGANQFTADAYDVTFSDLLNAGLLGSPLEISGFNVVDSSGVVTNANFELVTDGGTGRLLLRTTAAGAFDMLVDPARTITITVNGNIDANVQPGDVILNDADVHWTSLSGDPGQRSTFTPDATERTGAGGINDYFATDDAAIHILNVDLQKLIVTTSENATSDPEAVVIGEILRYRVQIAIPEFGTPTNFHFIDLLPAGMILVDPGTALIGFVTDAGDNLVSTTLMDSDPFNPPDLYLTGDESNVATLVPEFNIPGSLLTFATVGGRSQITFDLGNVTNPASPDNDLEFVIAEFNVLVANTAANQSGVTLVNEVTTVQGGVASDPVFSPAVRIAEADIDVLDKSVVSLTDPSLPGPTQYDAGDRVRYRVNYHNGVGANVATAYDVRLVDAPPPAKMIVDPTTMVVLRNGSPLVSGFTNNSTSTTIDVVVDVVDPGDTISVIYEAVLTSAVQAGETIANTADVTWTSLPGENGTLVNPTGTTTPGASGDDDGERNGSGGVNDYFDDASTTIAIISPELDKNILDTSLFLTSSSQFDPNLVDLAIGEQITYRITITVPEGTSTLTLTDLLPLINAGTVVFTSAQVVEIGGNISGSALAVGAPGVVAGSTVTFDFGTVVNAPDNVNNRLDRIVVDVTGTLTDLPENVAGVEVINTATLDYGFGTVSDNAVAEIVEPLLDIQKEVVPTTGDAGDIFTYTVVVSHLPNSSSAAFNVVIADLLNSGNLELIPGAVIVTGSPGAVVTAGNNPGDVTVTIEDAVLPLGQMLTISYQARLTTTPIPGDIVPNTATLDYDSSDAPDARHRDDNDDAEISVNANSISGAIYADLNNNGLYEPGAGETLITTPITVQLTGTDHLGNTVNTQLITSTGIYTFDLLRPGEYTVTQVNQPAGFVDGGDTPGTPFGGVGTSGGTPRDADAITTIVIPSGGNVDGVNYNFGELPEATIGSFVWEDSNGNGIQDVGEPGIDGVEVMLVGTDDLGTVNLTTTTAGGGQYSFANLRPGSYQVVFTAPTGYVFTAQDVGANDAIDSDASPNPGETDPFTLAIGQTDNSRDAGLYQPILVGDFVWYDIDTDGVQDPGEPGIPGATVTFTWLGPNGVVGGGDDAIFTDTTDASGSYGIDSLPPGEYTTAVTGLPNGLTVQTSGVAAFTLVSGQDRLDIDFGYVGPGSLGDLVWFDVNRDGSSVGEPGIAGVTVTATWFGFDGVEGTADDLDLADVTDSSGNYSFVQLPLGDYHITVDDTTLPPGLVSTYDLDSGTASPDGTTLVTLTLLQPNELDADFGYTGQAAFGDRVWFDVDGDGVQEAGEVGIPGVTMTATWAGPDNDLASAGDNVLLTTTTAADGLYGFTDLPAGLWQVAVTGGLPAGLANTGDPDGTFDGTTTFTLGINDNLTDQDFGYQGINSLAGFVYRDLDVDGLREPLGESGIAGVTVTLTGLLPGGAIFTLTTTTGPLGAYAFVGLPDGDYTITETQPPSVISAGSAGFYNGLDSLGNLGGTNPDLDDNRLEVTLAGGQDGVEYNFGEIPPSSAFGFVYIDIDSDGMLDPGEPGIAQVQVTISGTAFAGTPLARPLTAIDAPPGGLVVTTNASGRWEFPLLPPGTYSIVETQPAGYVDGLEDDADLVGPPATVGNDVFSNLILTSQVTRGPFNFGEIAINGELAGTVYVDLNNNSFKSANEVGIPGVTVTLTGIDAGGNSVNASVVTDAAGNFRFTRMLPGTYTLTEVHPAEFVDGLDRAGNAGGTAGNDVITGITLAPNQIGINYLFGERGLAVVSKRCLIMPASCPGRPPGGGVTPVNPLPVALFRLAPEGAVSPSPTAPDTFLTSLGWIPMAVDVMPMQFDSEWMLPTDAMDPFSGGFSSYEPSGLTTHDNWFNKLGDVGNGVLMEAAGVDWPEVEGDNDTFLGGETSDSLAHDNGHTLQVVSSTAQALAPTIWGALLADWSDVGHLRAQRATNLWGPDDSTKRFHDDDERIETDVNALVFAELQLDLLTDGLGPNWLDNDLASD